MSKLLSHRLGRLVATYKYRVLVVLVCLIALYLPTSCGVTKHIPEGKYLLKDAKIVVDTKELDKAELASYLVQKPNDHSIGVWIYSNAGQDTSRWITRWIQKLGSAPVIYDKRLATQSVKEIKQTLKNKGYLNAELTLKDTTYDRKAYLTYKVVSKEPHRLRSYQIDMPDKTMDSLVKQWQEKNRSVLAKGTAFDLSKLEKERNQLSSYLRNRGYYTAAAADLHYLADTSLNANLVDLNLLFRDSVTVRPYYIHSVQIVSDYDPFASGAKFRLADSIRYKDIDILYDSTHFIRPSMLERNVVLHPKQLYSERRTTQAYNSFNSIGVIRKTNITYDEVMVNDTAMLDCKIYLTEGNIHGIQAGIDGTNKAGDLGLAANISYNHNNIFNGAEVLGIKLRGAYEFMTGNTDSLSGRNYYELGIGASLKFPQAHFPIISKLLKNQVNVSTVYSAGFDTQERPEYQRDFFSLSWKFTWFNYNKTISQSFSPIDINYVMMPWMSPEFSDYLNQSVNSLTKYSYENIFTAGLSYNILISNSNVTTVKRRFHTIRVGVETSGNLLNGIFKMTGAEKSGDGQYNILGNPFAQYVKGDFDYSHTLKMNQRSSFATHLALGAAYAFGNSDILPFEKRYYAGGSNSIRGWRTRYLGPGSFNKAQADVSAHTGDVNLALSAEYRYKLLKYLEVAAFSDAGNIWTIRNYVNQPGGQFQLSSFYKEIALGAGVGLRIDLSFLILRFDFAKRVYDPAIPEGENRWTFLSKGFGGNSGFYFAIGYPF